MARALCVAAAAGDIPAIAAYFAQDHVGAEPEEIDGDRVARESESWFAQRDYRGFFFRRVIKHNQVEVLEWFFSQRIFGSILARLLSAISLCAVRSRTYTVEIMDMILSSVVFRDFLTLSEQERFLSNMLFMPGKHVNDDLRNLLIAHGANVNAGEGSLRDCVFVSRSRRHPTTIPSVVSLLEKNGMMLVGAQVLTHNEYVGWPEIARRLLKLGVVGNDAEAAKALVYAARWGRDQVMKLLLEEGFVDVDARERYGGTAIIAATRSTALISCLPSGPFESMNSRIVREMVALLLNFGADITIKDATGLTCLDSAVAQSQIRTVELLLKHGADPNIEAYSGCLLQLALSKAQLGRLHESAIPVLLRHGADPSRVARNGKSFYELLMERDDGQAFVNQHAELIARR